MQGAEKLGEVVREWARATGHLNTVLRYTATIKRIAEYQSRLSEDF